ncbi:uncharacterized protein LOC128237121 isoform X2 [Mya arenaria]|uniref:uncharacterized protein LOC128237121 isoform X2 n=1 Tax=Mya arenaria TaxID=6604 RepID=UPI0022E00F0C|nr:uncharacterized protein LOC128237121 isoform X2 [Mya arenaria]
MAENESYYRLLVYFCELTVPILTSFYQKALKRDENGSILQHLRVFCKGSIYQKSEHLLLFGKEISLEILFSLSLVTKTKSIQIEVNKVREIRNNLLHMATSNAIHDSEEVEKCLRKLRNSSLKLAYCIHHKTAEMVKKKEEEMLNGDRLIKEYSEHETALIRGCIACDFNQKKKKVQSLSLVNKCDSRMTRMKDIRQNIFSSRNIVIIADSVKDAVNSTLYVLKDLKFDPTKCQQASQISDIDIGDISNTEVLLIDNPSLRRWNPSSMLRMLQAAGPIIVIVVKYEEWRRAECTLTEKFTVISEPKESLPESKNDSEITALDHPHGRNDKDISVLGNRNVVSLGTNSKLTLKDDKKCPLPESYFELSEVLDSDVEEESEYFDNNTHLKEVDCFEHIPNPDLERTEVKVPLSETSESSNQHSLEYLTELSSGYPARSSTQDDVYSHTDESQIENAFQSLRLHEELPKSEVNNSRTAVMSSEKLNQKRCLSAEDVTQRNAVMAEIDKEDPKQINSYQCQQNGVSIVESKEHLGAEDKKDEMVNIVTENQGGNDANERKRQLMSQEGTSTPKLPTFSSNIKFSRCGHETADSEVSKSGNDALDSKIIEQRPSENHQDSEEVQIGQNKSLTKATKKEVEVTEERQQAMIAQDRSSGNQFKQAAKEGNDTGMCSSSMTRQNPLANDAVKEKQNCCQSATYHILEETEIRKENMLGSKNASDFLDDDDANCKCTTNINNSKKPDVFCECSIDASEPVDSSKKSSRFLNVSLSATETPSENVNISCCKHETADSKVSVPGNVALDSKIVEHKPSESHIVCKVVQIEQNKHDEIIPVSFTKANKEEVEVTEDPKQAMIALDRSRGNQFKQAAKEGNGTGMCSSSMNRQNPLANDAVIEKQNCCQSATFPLLEEKELRKENMLDSKNTASDILDEGDAYKKCTINIDNSKKPDILCEYSIDSSELVDSSKKSSRFLNVSLSATETPAENVKISCCKHETADTEFSKPGNVALDSKIIEHKPSESHIISKVVQVERNTHDEIIPLGFTKANKEEVEVTEEPNQAMIALDRSIGNQFKQAAKEGNDTGMCSFSMTNQNPLANNAVKVKQNCCQSATFQILEETEIRMEIMLDSKNAASDILDEDDAYKKCSTKIDNSKKPDILCECSIDTSELVDLSKKSTRFFSCVISSLSATDTHTESLGDIETNTVDSEHYTSSKLPEIDNTFNKKTVDQQGSKAATDICDQSNRNVAIDQTLQDEGRKPKPIISCLNCPKIMLNCDDQTHKIVDRGEKDDSGYNTFEKGENQICVRCRPKGKDACSSQHQKVANNFSEQLCVHCLNTSHESWYLFLSYWIKSRFRQSKESIQTHNSSLKHYQNPNLVDKSSQTHIGFEDLIPETQSDVPNSTVRSSSIQRKHKKRRLKQKVNQARQDSLLEMTCYSSADSLSLLGGRSRFSDLTNKTKMRVLHSNIKAYKRVTKKKKTAGSGRTYRLRKNEKGYDIRELSSVETDFYGSSIHDISQTWDSWLDLKKERKEISSSKDVARRMYMEHFDCPPVKVFGLRTFFDRVNTGIPLSEEEQHQFEWLRFISFAEYQGNGSGIVLARNGFYHNPEDGPNSTRCFACDARYNEWEMFDNVVERHTRLSPNCPLHHGNIGEGARRNISIVSDDVPRRRPAQQQTAVTAEPTGRNVQDSEPARSTSSSSAAAAATSGASSVSSVAATSTTSSAGSFIHSHLPSQSRNPIATSLTRVSGHGNFGRPVTTTIQQVTVPSLAKPQSLSSPSTSESAVASSASAVGGIAASVANTHISSGSQHSGFTSMQPTSDPNNTDRMYHLNPTTQIRGMGMVDEPYNEISVPPPQQGISVSGNHPPSSIFGGGPVGAGAFTTGQPQSIPVSGHTQVSELRSSSVPLVQGLSGSPGLAPHQEARPPPPSTQQALSYQQRAQGLGGGSGSGGAPPDRARGTGLPGLDPDLTAGIHIVSPRHPDYNTLTARINSFSGWPSHLDQNPRMMGEAGFFYVGVADFCRCYACGGGLRNWQPGDDPVLEHARWFPQCEYIIKLKGQAFVTEIQRHVSNLSASNRTPAETPTLSENNSQDPLDCETGRQLMSMGFPQARTRRAIRALRRTHGRDPTPDEVLDWMLEDHTDSEPEDSESATPAAILQPTSSITHSSTTTTTTSNLTTAPTGSINVTSSTSYFSRGASQENTKSEATPPTVTNQREISPSGGKIREANTGEGKDSRMEDDVRVGNSDKQEPKNGGGKKKKKKKGKGSKSNQEVEPGFTEGASGGPEEEENNDNGTQIRQENEKLREMQTCKICMERQVNTTLLPCGHLVSCDRCASRLAKCPICRTKIKGSVKTFMT